MEDWVTDDVQDVIRDVFFVRVRIIKEFWDAGVWGGVYSDYAEDDDVGHWYSCGHGGDLCPTCAWSEGMPG